MKKEDADFLIQLGKSLNEAGTKLEDAYQKKNYDEFLKLKRLVLNLQEKIRSVAR